MRDYALAADGVFETVQGEGVHFGVPMVFVRFAGCPVGCPQCDTDYRPAGRATAAEIARRACEVASPLTRWVFLTGGEPMVWNLEPVAVELRRAGFRIAAVTAGEREVRRDLFDFLAVSPHRLSRWVQRAGDQINLVPGLHGLALADVQAEDFGGFPADARFVTPLSADPARVAECRAWAVRWGWRLGVQAHLVWNLP